MDNLVIDNLVSVKQSIPDQIIAKIDELSYDIVKAHGGELRVVTKESRGSEFIIQLPIS